MNVAMMSPKQIEILPRLIIAGAKVGYALIKKGVTAFDSWRKEMRENLGAPLSNAGFSNAEIDEWIQEMWDADFPINGKSGQFLNGQR